MQRHVTIGWTRAHEFAQAAIEASSRMKDLEEKRTRYKNANDWSYEDEACFLQAYVYWENILCSAKLAIQACIYHEEDRENEPSLANRRYVD